MIKPKKYSLLNISKDFSKELYPIIVNNFNGYYLNLNKEQVKFLIDSINYLTITMDKHSIELNDIKLIKINNNFSPLLKHNALFYLKNLNKEDFEKHSKYVAQLIVEIKQYNTKNDFFIVLTPKYYCSYRQQIIFNSIALDRKDIYIFLRVLHKKFSLLE